MARIRSMPPGQVVRRARKEKLCPPAIVVSPSTDPDIPNHLLSSHPVFPVSRPVIIKELPEGSYSWASADQLEELTIQMIQSKLNDERVANFPQLVKGFEMAREEAMRNEVSNGKQQAEVEAEIESGYEAPDQEQDSKPSYSRGKAKRIQSPRIFRPKLKDWSIHLLTPIHPPTSPLNHDFAFHLRFDTISHPGVDLFLSQLFGNTTHRQVIEKGVQDVRTNLYPNDTRPLFLTELEKMGAKKMVEKEVRSTTLIIRDVDGVAVTSGKTIDEAHKEIQLSANYITSVMKRFDGDKRKVEKELRGVITHELVHVLQHDGDGTAPGGLIEGIADWVRMKADLVPPHWQKYEAGERWDSGYEHTAYFLQFASRYVQKPWLVPLLNQSLAHYEWSDKLFEIISGRPISHVWAEYKRYLSKHHSTVSPSPSTA